MRAFSLPELLVSIVIIGVISAVGIGAFFFLVRRARVQSVALEVAGWIENVRNAAADEISQDTGLGGCVLTFTPLPSMAADAPLAIADCNVPEDELSVPQTIQQDTVTIVSPGTIIFTPRGLWTDADGTPGVPFLMTLTLDGGGPLRCVRLTPTLGAVEIGRPNNLAGATCEEWQTL